MNATDENFSDSLAAHNLFADPEGYYEPEKEPTFFQHKLLSGETLRLRLVGYNPLWVGTHTSCVVPTDLLRVTTSGMEPR